MRKTKYSLYNYWIGFKYLIDYVLWWSTHWKTLKFRSERYYFFFNIFFNVFMLFFSNYLNGYGLFLTYYYYYYSELFVFLNLLCIYTFLSIKINLVFNWIKLLNFSARDIVKPWNWNSVIYFRMRKPTSTTKHNKRLAFISSVWLFKRNLEMFFFFSSYKIFFDVF